LIWIKGGSVASPSITPKEGSEPCGGAYARKGRRFVAHGQGNPEAGCAHGGGKGRAAGKSDCRGRRRKKGAIETLGKPSGLSEDEKVKLASSVIQRAVRNSLTEVLLYRFPNILCTDKGRAINQHEAGWERTLTGIPREIFQLWNDHLKSRGYRINYQTIDFTGGVPGDIGITISWA